MFSKANLGNEKYPALTGIRALGAAAVFFDHFYGKDATIIINVMAFFFVLSGFLITRIYYNKLELSGKWLSKYFINRFARIYPVYFLLLTVAILLHQEYISSGQVFRNYTLTQGFLNSSGFIIQPCWSLTVEECFYFFAPLMIIMIKRYNFFLAFLVAFAMLGMTIVISTFNLPVFSSSQFIFSNTFFGHFCEFYSGVFLALIVLKTEKKSSDNVRGIKWTLLGATGVLFFIIWMMLIYTVKPLNTSLIILINNFLITVPIAALYYGFLFERTYFSRFLSSKIMGLLGRSSYAFYVLHMIVITYISRPLLSQYMNQTQNLIVTFVITTFISIVLFLLYEEPLNIFIRRKFKSWGFNAEIPAWIPSK